MSFFQAKGLGTQLNGIVEPLALLPMLVFHRNEQTSLLFDDISKSRQAQFLAVEIQARRLYGILPNRLRTSLVDSTVKQSTFQYKFVDQHIALHKLV